MAIEIITGYAPGNDVDEKVVMFCNTSGWAFGPVFASAEEANDFRRFCLNLTIDPRAASNLEGIHDEWREHRKAIPLATAMACKECGYENIQEEFPCSEDCEDSVCPSCGSGDVSYVEHLI